MHGTPVPDEAMRTPTSSLPEPPARACSMFAARWPHVACDAGYSKEEFAIGRGVGYKRAGLLHAAPRDTTKTVDCRRRYCSCGMGTMPSGSDAPTSADGCCPNERRRACIKCTAAAPLGRPLGLGLGGPLG